MFILLRQLIILLFLSSTLTACGFHLRGHAPLPAQLKVLYLQTNAPYSDFTKQLKSTLTSAKVMLADNAKAAPFTLQILSEGSSQQLTGTSSNGQTSTYISIYTVVYQLLNRNGAAIISPQTVSTSRSYSVTSNQLLGDISVQNNLNQQMQREAIYQMVNQLRAPQTLDILNRNKDLIATD